MLGASTLRAVTCANVTKDTVATAWSANAMISMSALQESISVMKTQTASTLQEATHANASQDTLVMALGVMTLTNAAPRIRTVVSILIVSTPMGVTNAFANKAINMMRATQRTESVRISMNA